jgi:hypothetical protein
LTTTHWTNQLSTADTDSLNKTVGQNRPAPNKMLVQWPGSVSSLLSVSLFKLCRGTGRNWSGLTFRFAAFLSLPIPATEQAPVLCTIEPRVSEDSEDNIYKE